ncbi:MAG: amidohydrolase family protein [Patescibacteria group bacterium]
MKPRKQTSPIVFVIVGLVGLTFIIAAFQWTRSKEMPIVNVHESVESVAEIIKLQTTMVELGITHTVLQAIPEDLLYFEGEGVDLGGVEENNAALKAAVTEYPEQFSYFCTLDPNDPLRLEKVESCVTDGAVGVKLYNGYSYAHQTPLDDAKLNEFYALLEEKDLPLMLPVNTAEYEAELRNVLTLHADLTVICPHFCLASKDLPRLTSLMTEFPNLYTDTSFGHIDFAAQGFETIRSNKEDYEEFFDTFQDRILFGTDAVVTSYEDKTVEWLNELYADYITVFTKDLDLPSSIQKKIFYKNWMGLTQ